MKVVIKGRIVVVCDFCSTTQEDDDRVLLAGPASVAICDVCVGLAASHLLALGREKAEKAKSEAPA